MGLLWNCNIKTLLIYENKLCVWLPVRKTSHLLQINIVPVVLSMSEPVPTRKDVVKSVISEYRLRVWTILSMPAVHRIIARAITLTCKNNRVQKSALLFREKTISEIIYWRMVLHFDLHVYIQRTNISASSCFQWYANDFSFL